MSNYVKTTDFSVKDALPTGDASKKVRGTELDSEFDAIETAIATKAEDAATTASLALKAPIASPTFTGTATAPILIGSAQPSFHAYRSTNQTSDTGGVCIFDTEDFDTAGNYNNATGVFTAPVAGVYVFSAVLFMQKLSTSDGGYIYFKKNGTTAVSGYAKKVFSPSDNTSVELTATVKLAANDTITVVFGATSGGGFNANFYIIGGRFNHFSGHLLG